MPQSSAMSAGIAAPQRVSTSQVVKRSPTVPEFQYQMTLVPFHGNPVVSMTHARAEMHIAYDRSTQLLYLQR